MTQGKTCLSHDDVERRALSVDEVAAELGVSTGLVRLELRRRHLKGTRFGRRILIMRSELERYLAERAGTEGEAAMAAVSGSPHHDGNSFRTKGLKQV